MATYVSYIKQNRIVADHRIFINSLPAQIMTTKEIDWFEKTFEGYLDHVVMEITEESKINREAMAKKLSCIKKWNADIALDDYGSGYNSEYTLLKLSPRYIKVDLDLIRNIDKDANKQRMVQNIVAYAHERQMYIIAEGIETKEESAYVISIGVDYLQGYYYGRPSQEPICIPNNM